MRSKVWRRLPPNRAIDGGIHSDQPVSLTEAMRGLREEIWPTDPAEWLEQERASWDKSVPARSHMGRAR